MSSAPATKAYQIIDHDHDVVVGGGCGLRARKPR
jgi:hypothetical protein